MPRRTSVLAGVAFGLLYAPTAVRAQDTSPEFNVAAGLAAPLSSFSNRTNSGFDLTAGVTFRQAEASLATVRLEVMYNDFQNSGGSQGTQIAALTVNGVFPIGAHRPKGAQPQAMEAGPFIIVGAGLYNTAEEVADGFGNQGTVSSNNLGVNAGGGYRFAFSGFNAYVEARWHTVATTDYTFVPFVFGVTF